MIYSGGKITVDDLRVTVYSGNQHISAASTAFIIRRGATVYHTGSGTYSQAYGAYFPDITLSPSITGGLTDIAWSITISGSLVPATTLQTFMVYSNDLYTLDTAIFSGKTREYIELLRYSLRDFNPDLHYRFNPVLDPERNYTDNYHQEVIWDDRELYFYLRIALSDVNSFPPMTSFTFDTIPEHYLAAFMLSAKYQACQAKALNWAAEDYTFAVGQTNVDISRQQKYTTMAESYKGAYDKAVEMAKHSREKFVALRGNYI